MKTTTLNRIRAHSPCKDSWENLLKGLGKTQADNEPLAFATILEICGLDDALWAARAEPQYNWRLLAVFYGRRVQHLNSDPRVSGCLDVAERYANGQATDEELTAAWAAASDAARDAARAAAGAAWAASDAAGDAAWDAVWVAVWVAWAARAAAGDAERKEQERLFLEFVSK